MIGQPKSLQLREDMAFQRRSWRAERIGWTIMALLVVAALLGLFAVGPLSWTTTSDAAGLLQVEHERFQRRSAPASLTIDVAAAAVPTASVEIEVDDEFLRTYEIRTMRPQPAESVATPDGLRLRFRVEPRAPATIRLYLQPERIGRARPTLGLTGRTPVELPVFVYP